jgi:hypothetical protein
MKALGLAGLLAASAASHAAGVLISNPSFELPACPAGCNGGIATAGVSGWTVEGSAGVFAPGQYYWTASYGYLATDGGQVAYAEIGRISQVLSTSLAVDTVYTLSVDIGRRGDTAFPGYTVELLAGNSVLASGDYHLGVPDPNKFGTATLTYTALQGDANLGQALGIRLSSLGWQTNFDNVRLDATPIAANQVTHTPVPAALPLLASALAGLGLLRRRRIGE